MKVLFVLFSLAVIASSAPDFLYQETAPGIYTYQNLSEPVPSITVDENDIKIIFRSLDNPHNTDPLDIEDPSAVSRAGFAPKKDTFFIVHGWKNEYDSPVCETISDALLGDYDVNIFIIDWSKIASELYVQAVSAVPKLGVVLGTLITSLTNHNELNLDKAVLVGHSLGAHVAGLAGQALDGRINHIVGLDPALPLFSHDNTNGRLDASDAKFVQIIHTCPGGLGFDIDIGHVDYWPNGDTCKQPGCGMDITGSCSHGRSYLYFAESLTTSGFLSYKCDNYKDYENGKCSSTQTSLMGEYTPDQKASGSFYLKTNDKAPFAQH